MEKLSSLSVVFPAYNDEKTIGQLVKKAASFLPQLTEDSEIIVVNDGSTDTTGDVLAKMQKQTRSLRVITHERNLGYGAALTSGFLNAVKEFIFYTDGDGQYDVGQLRALVEAFDGRTDLVTGFKLNRADPWFRRIIGSVYNQFVKMAFGLHVKDVDCDFRLFRRKIIEGVTFRVKSGAFDVEFIKHITKKEVRIKEIGVHHYPRRYGQSQFFRLSNVGRSLLDLGRLWIM